MENFENIFESIIRKLPSFFELKYPPDLKITCPNRRRKGAKR